TTIVDIATSNVSGYKLMMNSDYRTDGTSSDTPSAAEFTTNLINTDSTIAATEVGQIATTAGSSTASSTSYWNYSKSWNESLGPEGQTKDFSSTNLASASLENLAIPAQSAPDTVRDDVDIATSSSQTSISVNVNAATDKSSGIYKNELVFTAIANPIPVDYTLTFDKNTTDIVTNLPDPLTATTMATSYTFTIPDTSGEGTLPAMTRDGYSFVGWSTSASTRQGSGSGPDGLYVAGDTYTVVADDSGNPDYTTHGTGSATLYAVWALEYTYTLNYSCDAGATNCPSTQTTTTTNTSHTFTIPSTTPELDGYNFINYTDNGAGAGNTYNPGDTVTLTSTSNTKTLTANFEQAIPAFWTITTMQQMTPEVCASVYTPSNVTNTNKSSLNIIDKAHAANYTATADGTNQIPETTLTDSRDQKTYTVRKLADGNCWMTDNLAYDILGLYNGNPSRRGIGSKNDGSTFEITDASFASGVVGYYTTNNTYNYVINPNTKSLSGITRYSYSGDISGNTEYYYNWTGATAGQGSQAQSSGDIDGSICPAGWRMPTVSTATTDANWDTSWGKLTYTYLGLYTNTSSNGYQTLESYPISLYRAGNVNNGNHGVAQRGYYWSSSAWPSNSNFAYRLFFDVSYMYPQDSGSKSPGYQVRCLATR
ncbi:hypothetical protein IKF40_01590, partial [Candidatus Saccharibacteria bacterium]|nr:hypothetical protein [Candidatus Saccharibacteria bacterium]